MPDSAYKIHRDGADFKRKSGKNGSKSVKKTSGAAGEDAGENGKGGYDPGMADDVTPHGAGRSRAGTHRRQPRMVRL